MGLKTPHKLIVLTKNCLKGPTGSFFMAGGTGRGRWRKGHRGLLVRPGGYIWTQGGSRGVPGISKLSKRGVLGTVFSVRGSGAVGKVGIFRPGGFIFLTYVVDCVFLQTMYECLLTSS